MSNEICPECKKRLFIHQGDGSFRCASCGYYERIPYWNKPPREDMVSEGLKK